MTEVRIPAHVKTTFFEESAVLLDLQKNTYFALNDSAADLWKLLTQVGSYEEALKELIELYQEPIPALRQDMEDLVNSLVQAGLLERVAKP
jgi:hypothetical protein